MVIIGIDPSINSTGICINRDGRYTYYIISSKMTKKMENFIHSKVKFLPYNKESYTDMEYSDKETVKSNNLYNIVKIIEDLIKKYKPDNIIMEGISYGSTSGSALVDLSGLNYMIRMVCINRQVPFTIVSPSGLKKFVCANGQADKELIIESWKKMDKNIQDISDIKIDDLADAFFLSNHPV